ncbi:zinc finger SWIM domain protein [Flammeovirgaceae bacterium 311]|nr:zinc finger SWIM domain protein [Flammeovirgaceae bacterium 311]
MSKLFTSIQDDLKSFLESLSPDDIQLEISPATYHKGEQYYEWELVDDAQYSFDKSRLTAHVQGGQDYSVLLSLQEGSIQASCSCPATDVCKHIAAVLLYASQHPDEVEIGENRSEGSPVYQHLLDLPKETLVSLVLEFAPEELLLQIHNRYASAAEAMDIYNRTEAAIQKLFSNTELLYSPTEFNEALENRIGRLLGLEHQLQDKLRELIFYIIREVENAMDTGYLYDDESDTSFVQPEAFATLVENYTRELPYDAKIRFVTQLDAMLNEASYDTFDSLAEISEASFQEDELPAVKAILLAEYGDLSVSLTENYYALVQPLLTESEKETILLYLKEEDSIWLLELAELYRQQGREEDAIEVIKASLAADPDMYGEEQVYLLYLDLLGTQGQELEAASIEAMNCCASSSILEKIEAVGGTDWELYERIMEQKNPQGLLEYLEKRGRLGEAISLLKRSDTIWDHYRYLFFKKHKSAFPKEAVQYFTDVIGQNLEYTGNSHYYTIVEALKQIRQVNESQAAAIVEDIRSNYSRRRNLMNLLSEF